MLKRAFLGAAACAMLIVASAAYTQEQVTLVLRSGERLSGQLVDLSGSGFEMRVGGDTRQVPKNDVAVIDFTGSGQGFPADEVNKLGATHLVVLRNGQTVSGELFDIGGTQPLHFTLKADNAQREIMSNEIARIYLARPTADLTTSGTTGATAGPNQILVPGNRQWTSTGIVVGKGQTVLFEVTGQIQLSADTNDIAVSAGSQAGRKPTANAPIPSALAGALIGRIGVNGQPFGIGNQASIPMPAAGQLFLGVNDDFVGDNSGQFTVTVQPQPIRRRR
jgi:small nuclear ribonucleoprotein (snRNP)-like protein